MRTRLVVAAAASSIVLIAVALLIIFNVGNIRHGFAAPKPDIELSIYPTYNNADGTTYLDLAIYAKNVGDSAKLGTSSFVVNYNPENIIYNSLITAGSNYNSGNYQALIAKPYGSAAYSIETSLFSGPGVSINSGDKGSLIGTLRFEVRNIYAPTGVSWSNDQTGYSAIFKDDDKTQFVVGFVNPSMGSALPVTLLNFTAELKDHETEIKWTTATELNNNFFTVERSDDAVNFAPLFTKHGNGTTQIKHDYSGYDEHPLLGTSYYRLRQTDFNGRSQTFNIVPIHNQESGDIEIISIVPTVFHDNATISYKVPKEGEVNVRIVNMNGKIISDKTVTANAGENTYAVTEGGNWEPGMYIANLTYNTKTVSSKMIKQ